MSVIVKGNTVKRSGARALGNEVLLKNKNDEVPRVVSSPYTNPREFFSEAKDMAKMARVQNAFYHAQISTSDLLSIEEIEMIFEEWRKEFDPDKKHDLIIIEHEKKRADGKSADKHYHGILASVGADGSILDVSHNHARNEKIARICEVKLGQELLKGAHNRAVLHALEADPEMADVAQKVRDARLHEGPTSKARYGSKVRMAAERLGVDLPGFAQFIKDNETKPDFMSKLAEKLADQGLNVRKGDKRNVAILETKEGAFIGNFNDLLGLKTADTKRILADLKAEKEAPARKLSEPAIEAHKVGLDAANGQRSGAQKDSNTGAGNEPANREIGRDKDGHNVHQGHPAGCSEAADGRGRSDDGIGQGIGGSERDIGGSDGGIERRQSRDGEGNRSVQPNEIGKRGDARNPAPSDRKETLIDGAKRLITTAVTRFAYAIYSGTFEATKERPEMPKLPAVDTRPAGTIKGRASAPKRGSGPSFGGGRGLNFAAAGGGGSGGRVSKPEGMSDGEWLQEITARLGR